MHPPTFGTHQRLSEWPDCFLELNCCKGMVLYPVKLVISKYGDQTFNQVLGKFHCGICTRQPAPVYLCASHHRNVGPCISPNWAVELISAKVQPALLETKARMCVRDQI